MIWNKGERAVIEDWTPERMNARLAADDARGAMEDAVRAAQTKSRDGITITFRNDFFEGLPQWLRHYVAERIHGPK